MSGSNSSLVRPIAWVLLGALVGVYLLYDWYSGHLAAELAHKDSRIAEVAEQVRDRDARIGVIEGEVAQLHAQIQALTGQHSGERQQLKDRIAAFEQTKSQLEADLEALRRTDESALAAEQAKTAAVIEERDRGIAAFKALQGQYEMAVEKAESLRAELTGLQQVIAESTLEHREQIEALERHLNERVTLAKATPKDTELMRAAQAAGLLPQDIDLDEDDAALADQLAATQAALQALQAEFEAARDEHETQLAALEGELNEARAALSEQASRGESAEVVAAIQARLALTEAELSKVKGEAAALEEGGAAQASRLAEAEARIAALTEQLVDEQAGKTRIAKEKEDIVAELNAALERAEAELADLQAEVSAAGEAAEGVGAKALDDAGARIAALEKALEEERGISGQLRSALGREADAAVAGLRSLYQGFSALGGTHTDRGMLLKLANTELRFQPGMATLTTNDLPSLDRIAGLLAEHPDLSVRIEGHTDSLGDEVTNLALSRERAEAVKQALVERGVEATRLNAEGLGPARPIADNAAPAGRAQNRRVEVYVIEG